MHLPGVFETLPERKKWREPQRNFCVEDIVIQQDKSHYNEWKLAKGINERTIFEV